MYKGETEKNIQAVFVDAEKQNAILVFDEAEGLFGSRSSSGSQGAVDRSFTLSVGLLLQHIESHSGICIVVTNMKEAIDKAFFRRFRFVLDFDMPDATQRELIWKSSIPEDCPLSSDVSLCDLSRYKMTGGCIRNALLRAATQAALRSNKDDNKLTMDDLISACKAEMSKKDKKNEQAIEMYS